MFRGILQGFVYSFIILQITLAPLAQSQSLEDQSLGPDAPIVLTPKPYATSIPHDFSFQPEDYLGNNSGYTPEERQVIEDYFNVPTRGVMDMLILERVLAEKLIDLEKLKTPEQLASQIRKRDSDQEIKIEIPGLGKAEITALGIEKDSPIVTKFVLYRLNKAIISWDLRANETRDITEDEKSTMTDREYAIEKRERKARKAALDMYVAKVSMKTKVSPVHPEDIDPFPDMSQADPETFKSLYADFITHAKDNKVNKRYIGVGDAFTEGIDTIVLQHDGLQITSAQEQKNFKTLPPLEKVKAYWTAIYQGPRLNWEYWDNEKSIWKRLNTFRTGDAYVAKFSMIGQSSIYAAAQVLNNLPEIWTNLSHGNFAGAGGVALHSINPMGLALVAGWAVALGVTSTYRNWLMLSPENRQLFLFKSFLNSTLFNYIFTMGLHGANAVFSVSREALNNDWVALSNGIVTNFGKTWWMAVPRMNESNGKNVYQIKIGKLNTNVDKSFLDQQKWYLSSNALKTADLVIKGSLFTKFGIDWTPSRLLLLASIPVVHYMAMHHAEKNDYKEKYKLRQDWNEVVYVQRWTALRQKVFGLRDGEKMLTGDEKFIRFFQNVARTDKDGKPLVDLNGKPMVGYKMMISSLFLLPVPVVGHLASYMVGALPGLAYDTYVVLKLTGIGVLYLSKFTFEALAQATDHVVTRMFSYDDVEAEPNRLESTFQKVKNATISGLRGEPFTCAGLFSK